MIEINLLPQELRKRRIVRFNLPKEYLSGALVIGIALIVILHILIQAVIIAKAVMLSSADRRMAGIQPQRQLVDEMKSEVQKYKSLEELFSRIGPQRIRAAAVLNLISDALPEGVWLTELSLSAEGGELAGACVSAGGGEIAQVGKLLNTLKQDAWIRGVFPELALSSVKRKKLGATDVAEFAMSAKKQVKSPAKK